MLPPMLPLMMEMDIILFLFQGYARLFGVFAVFFVIGVFYFRRTEEMKGPLIDSSFGFLVGGAIGKGVDRLLFGQVTDFIIRRGGILNLADHALEMGVFLLIIYGVVSWLKNKRKFSGKSQAE